MLEHLHTYIQYGLYHTSSLTVGQIWGTGVGLLHFIHDHYYCETRSFCMIDNLMNLICKSIGIKCFRNKKQL